MESPATDEPSNSREVSSVVSANLGRVRERIARSCERARRNPAEVTLVAVTKYAQLDCVRALVALGAVELGESRPQQLVARAAELDASIHWHLIGSLQRNKIRLVLPVTERIHSVDSLRLLDGIDRIAAELQVRPRVLIEVNLTGEESKHGFRRDELIAAWDQIIVCRNVQVDGLMTMAAYASDPEASRPTFAALRTLRDELRRNSPAEMPLNDLSMGMSGDFEVGIEEGATLVRVGSALWEGLE